MKKLITLMASLLLLTACGGSGSGEASTPAGDSSAPAQSSAQQDEHKLTFLEDGEIYIDFNFDNKPTDLAIRIGETTLTASGKAKMTKDFSYEIKGAFTASVNMYHAIDANGSTSAGKGEGIDAEAVAERANRYLGNFASKQYGYRVYFCLSDKANGWSKDLAGVDEIIKSYTGQQYY